ncbi:hypothetical protein [Rummeliibacillus stabekisii]|uniref:hypothetical protein n=1 Tax=Rummeliibacillus stabekisii TaxID=241244 RepID=UPI00371C98F9
MFDLEFFLKGLGLIGMMSFFIYVSLGEKSFYYLAIKVASLLIIIATIFMMVLGLYDCLTR